MLQQQQQPPATTVCNTAIHHDLQQQHQEQPKTKKKMRMMRSIVCKLPSILLLLSFLFVIEQCQQQRRQKQQQPPSSSSWFVEATVTGAITTTTTTTTTVDSKEERRTRKHPRRRDVLNSPNFIILFMDDLGYGDMGFTGHPTTQTPNLDYLAFHGKILTSWYSGCAACTGSRAALMTGRQWTRTGLPWVLGPTTPSGLPLNETTIAEQLKKKKNEKTTKEKSDSNDDHNDTAEKGGGGEGGDNGGDGEGEYATAIVGKWHLGQRPIYLPGNRGFDYYLGIPYSDDMGDAITTTCSASSDSDAASKSEWSNPYSDTTSSSAYLDHNFDGRKDDVDPAAYHLPLIYQEYNTTHVLEQPLDFTTLSQKYKTFTTNFITMHQDQPFFLYVPFSHVHVTSKSQEELQYSGCNFRNYTTRGKFGDALAEADDMVGSMVQTLKNLDLLNNTLILFTSDNGPWLSRGLSAGSEGLFTGRYSGYYDTGKATTWEGGIRMPAFAYWSGQIEPHSRSSEIISSLDVFPTLSRLAGIPLPQNNDSNQTIAYDGMDMTDILLSRSTSGGGGKSKHDFLFFYGTCHINVPYYTVTAVRHGPYKAHWCTAPGLSGGDNVTQIKVYDKLPLLFQVEEDPSEAFPLAEGNEWPSDPKHRDAMERIIKAYAMELSTFAFGKNIPYPDGPGEGPGLYGVCCDRSKLCNCTTATGGDNDDAGLKDKLIGILNIGTKQHHDRYHSVLGEDEPSPPRTRAQVMLQNVV